MILQNGPTETESDGSTLLQYESMRSQVLKMPKTFSEQSLGLALFIRQGMFAWTRVCHQCMPVVNSKPDKEVQAPPLVHQTTSEMIKVMANITLSNLQEALS